MGNAKSLEELLSPEIFFAISRLSPERKIEVANFIEYLIWRDNSRKKRDSKPGTT